MIKKILALLAILLAVLFIVVSMQSPEFRITRQAVIPAPPAQVFAQVNDFHKWEAWSPWAKLDPNTKETFTGPASGKGATFAWAGNNEVGEGKMTITESKPDELILIDLEFIKPFQATNLTEFTFKPEGNQTLVTWTMSGRNNFVGKAMSMLMNCDKMIGGMFEKGFDNMKVAVQSAR